MMHIEQFSMKISLAFISIFISASGLAHSISDEPVNMNDIKYILTKIGVPFNEDSYFKNVGIYDGGGQKMILGKVIDRKESDGIRCYFSLRDLSIVVLDNDNFENHTILFHVAKNKVTEECIFDDQDSIGEIIGKNFSSSGQFYDFIDKMDIYIESPQFEAKVIGSFDENDLFFKPRLTIVENQSDHYLVEFFFEGFSINSRWSNKSNQLKLVKYIKETNDLD